MSRYVRLTKATLLTDAFRELPMDSQWLYTYLLLTCDFAGVADWRPSRIAAATRGLSMAGVEAASVELEHNLWIVVDRTTEEALVRTFIRDDGLMNSWSMGPAMAKAHAKVASKALRGVIVHELRALQADEPDHKSWSHHLVQATLTKATMTADEAMSLLPRWTGEIQDSH